MKKHSRKLNKPYFTVENLNFSYKPDQSDQFDWLEPTLRSDQTEVEIYVLVRSIFTRTWRVLITDRTKWLW